MTSRLTGQEEFDQMAANETASAAHNGLALKFHLNVPLCVTRESRGIPQGAALPVHAPGLDFGEWDNHTQAADCGVFATYSHFCMWPGNSSGESGVRD
jgi:hypothetical protein